MKILQVIATVNPESGGPVESLKEVGKILIAQGHTCDVVSIDDENDSWVKEFPLPITAVGPGKSFYSYSSRLVPYLREHHSRYDAVIVRGIWRYNSFGAWRALRSVDTPYYVFTHGMLDPWFRKQYPLKHIKKYLYWPWGEYRVLRDAKAVLFTSEEERVLAKQSFVPYRCNEVVVAYGSKEPEQDRESLRIIFFERYPELRNKRIALFLGRIHEKKGCDNLIEAFHRFAKEHRDLHLVIAGPDQVGWQSALEKRVAELGMQDSVSWPGMLSGQDKWAAFAAAEVFILPSHQENFGISVAEALACETPVLISNKVNIWREIQESEAGFVADDTVQGTEELFEKWLSLNDSERQEKAKAARGCYEENFSLQRSAEALIQAIQ